MEIKGYHARFQEGKTHWIEGQKVRKKDLRSEAIRCWDRPGLGC